MSNRRLAGSARLGLALMLGLWLSAPAQAALIDIVVVGTWEMANANTTVNPFGLVAGDKFVMKGTYDDTTLFLGPGGVEASLDPTVNAGTSFEALIPHAAGPPNPLQFDHADHSDIGFAPTAEIEFDGTDPVLDPGSFRNFEIHVDFSFNGQSMSLDTFMGGLQTQTEMRNFSQGANLIVLGDGPVGDGVEHLQVVTNDIAPNAGGPYVFTGFSVSQALNGSFTGGSGLPTTAEWSDSGGPIASGLDATVSIADLGFTNALSATNLSLAVTESFTDFSNSDATSASYANSPPFIVAAVGSNLPGGAIEFLALFHDDDETANALVPGFETVALEFRFEGVPFLFGMGTLDRAALLAIFGAPGVYMVEAVATDFVGEFAVFAFDVTVNELPLPNLLPALSPPALGLLATLLLAAGLVGLRVRAARRGA